MAQLTLDVRPRALGGKKSRYLRRAGIVPANLYGAGLASASLQVDAKALIKAVATTSRNTLVTLKVHGETAPRTAFLWGIQRDPMTEDIVHVDFYHVDPTRKMRGRVPLTVKNVDPNLAKNELRVAIMIPALDVECLPGDLPVSITIDCTDLHKLGDDVKAAALPIPSGVTMLTKPTQSVAKVAVVQKVKEIEEAPAAAAAEGAAPAEGAAAAPAGEKAAEGAAPAKGAAPAAKGAAAPPAKGAAPAAKAGAAAPAAKGAAPAKGAPAKPEKK
jgi:large subunit ribosomal protein L25